MALYFFVIFISFIINSVLIIPFIDFLYKLKLQRAAQKTRDAFDIETPVFDKYHESKAGIPVGGGILTVITTTVLFSFFLILSFIFKKPLHANFPSLISEIKIL